MSVSKGDVQALTWIARRLREDTHGCGPWDPAGTYAVISELIGQNLAETVHRVVGHAVDPEGRTPGAIRRPFIPKRADEPARRQPAKAGEDCRRHPGEYVGSCRACAVEVLPSQWGDVELAPDDDRSAGRALVAEIRARRLGLPEPSPAPDAPTSEPAVDDAAADPVVGQPQDVQQRAGEPDDRPETACLAEGCYRPTRDGICDRCRAKALDEDVQAANAALIEQLQANQRARAATRPEPEPGPPRYFTHYDPERVHAAQKRAGEQMRRTTDA